MLLRLVWQDKNGAISVKVGHCPIFLWNEDCRKNTECFGHFCTRQQESPVRGTTELKMEPETVPLEKVLPPCCKVALSWCCKKVFCQQWWKNCALEIDAWRTKRLAGIGLCLLNDVQSKKKPQCDLSAPRGLKWIAPARKWSCSSDYVIICCLPSFPGQLRGIINCGLIASNPRSIPYSLQLFSKHLDALAPWVIVAALNLGFRLHAVKQSGLSELHSHHRRCHCGRCQL